MKHRLAQQWSKEGYETETEVQVGIPAYALIVDVVAEAEGERVAIEVGRLHGGERRVNWLLYRFDRVIHVPLKGVPDAVEMNYAVSHDYLRYNQLSQEVISVLKEQQTDMSARDVAAELEIDPVIADHVLCRLWERNEIQRIERGSGNFERLYAVMTDVPRDEIVRDIQRVSSILEGGLSRRLYRSQGKYATYVVLGEFGTWAKAADVADVSLVAEE